MTAIRLKTTVAKIGRQGFSNGERHLRPLTTLRKLYPPDTLDTAVALAARCEFSLRSLHYEYPEELVPPDTSPSEHLRALTEEGCKRRWPAGTPDCPPSASPARCWSGTSGVACCATTGWTSCTAPPSWTWRSRPTNDGSSG